MVNNYNCRLNLRCPTTKRRKGEGTAATVTLLIPKIACANGVEKICWKGYYSSVFQTYQNDRKWLNISPFKWVFLFSRVHWCSALSDLLAFFFLILCINPFTKVCASVCICVCEEAIPDASAGPVRLWGDGAQRIKGYTGFKTVKPVISVIKIFLIKA